jgi:hypothetical protein
MLEKPNIADELIISCLQEEYDLRVAELTFLPLGADLGTAVYRVVADDGTAYFLKLRKGLMGGNRYFQQIEVELSFDSTRQLQEKTITGGQFSNP